MTRLQGDDRPTYVLSYPRWVRRIRIGAIVLLTVVALARWIIAWVQFFRPLVEALANASGTSTGVGQTLSAALAAQPLRPLLSAQVSLVLAAAALAFIYDFLPDLAVTEFGLATRRLLGWQAIPWTKVQVVRIVRFEKQKRRLVLIQGNWSRWSPWPRLVSACLGAGVEPGLLFSSDIRDFKPLMLRLHQEVSRSVPDALFDEEFMSPTALLMLEPMPTLTNLVEQARDEGWPLGFSAQAMGAVTAGLALVQILLLALMGGRWWQLLVVIGLTEMEWLLGAFYLYALAEFFPARVEFRMAALLYPLPQVPRAVVTVPMAMLVAAGAPFLAAMLGLAAVVWAVILTSLLVQQMFYLRSILPAMIGGALQALFQFLVLAIVFG